MSRPLPPLLRPLSTLAAHMLNARGVRFLDAQFLRAPYGLIEHVGHLAPRAPGPGSHLFSQTVLRGTAC